MIAQGPKSPEEVRAAIERWSAIRSLAEHKGWQDVERALLNDKASAVEVLSSQVKDPFDIGRARGVIEEVNTVLNLVRSAEFEIEQLNKLEE